MSYMPESSRDWPSQKEPLPPVLAHAEDDFAKVEANIDALDKQPEKETMPDTSQEEAIARRVALEQAAREQSAIDAAAVERLQAEIRGGSGSGIEALHTKKEGADVMMLDDAASQELATYARTLEGIREGVATKGETTPGGELPSGMSRDLHGSIRSETTFQDIEGTGATSARPGVFRLEDLEREEEQRKRDAA